MARWFNWLTAFFSYLAFSKFGQDDESPMVTFKPLKQGNCKVGHGCSQVVCIELALQHKGNIDTMQIQSMMLTM